METFKEIKAFDVVAYLLCVGIKYIEPPIYRNGTVWFTYHDSPELEQHVRDFFSPHSRVNPNVFNAHLRAVNKLASSIKGSMGGGTNG